MPEEKHILVVDDEVGVRQSFRMILKDAYRVFTAKDAKGCLNIVKRSNLSLVLLDVKMPGIDGIETLRKIKNINSELPVIVLSGAGTHRTVIDALKLGAENFIVKPVNVSYIRKMVEETILQAENEKRKRRPSVEEILKREYFDTLQSLVEILEAKDPYTRKHSKQVGYYATLIAKQMGFSEEQLEIVKQSSLLHDIGKVGVSDSILHKPGKLSSKEWEKIKRHPQIGERILEPLRTFHIEQSMIRHHHERYNGTGYPDGLKGEDIPIYARILAVADAYTAMISSRPYRKKRLSPKQIISELNKNSGVQFDPSVINVFLKVLNKKQNFDNIRTGSFAR